MVIRTNPKELLKTFSPVSNIALFPPSETAFNASVEKFWLTLEIASRFIRKKKNRSGIVLIFFSKSR